MAIETASSSSAVDLFFCIASQDSERAEMGVKCMERWSNEPGVRHIVLRPEDCQVSPEEFQSVRRVVADMMGQSEFYILADDDCLPQDEPFIEQALQIMRDNSDFGILSLFPANCAIQAWTPEDYEPRNTDDILEHHSVGGIRICRRGVITEWPEQTGRGYDAEQCAAVRAAGYRVGYFKRFHMEHLGEGKTTVWQA